MEEQKVPQQAILWRATIALHGIAVVTSRSALAKDRRTRMFGVATLFCPAPAGVSRVSRIIPVQMSSCEA